VEDRVSRLPSSISIPASERPKTEPKNRGFECPLPRVYRNPLFILSSVFGIIGVQFFGLGLVAELLSRTYFEASDTAPYMIADRVNLLSEVRKQA